jgi:hypothetical protein
MGFDPYNRSLKIWDSIRTPIPKVGAHLGVWGFIPSHIPTFQVGGFGSNLPFFPLLTPLGMEVKSHDDS